MIKAGEPFPLTKGKAEIKRNLDPKGLDPWKQSDNSRSDQGRQHLS